MSIPWFASKGRLYLQFPSATPHKTVVRKIERIHTLIHAVYFIVVGAAALYMNFFVTPIFQSAHAGFNVSVPPIVYTLPYLTLAGLILMEGVIYFLKKQIYVREVSKHANYIRVATMILNPKEELAMLTFLGVFTAFLVFFYILPLQTFVGSVY